MKSRLVGIRTLSSFQLGTLTRVSHVGSLRGNECEEHSHQYMRITKSPSRPLYHIIKAQGTAVVKKVHIAKGKAVEKNQVLIEME